MKFKNFLDNLNEASEVSFKTLPKEKIDFLKRHRLDGEGGTYFEGINGTIVNFNKDKPRRSLVELKKLIADSQFRWIDISSIGF